MDRVLVILSSAYQFEHDVHVHVTVFIYIRLLCLFLLGYRIEF